MRRRWAWILLAVLSSATLDAGRRAAAQEADEPEQAAAPPPRWFRIADRTIDELTFGAGGNAASTRELGEARLRSRIAYIHQLCSLTAAQRTKLELAGRGDVKRFLDRVARVREELRHAEADIDRIRALVTELGAMGQRFRDRPADEQSLFSKTLRTSLDAEQSARYRRSWSEDRLKAHHSCLAWVVRDVWCSTGLSQTQSLRLHAVLLEETRPPRASGRWDYFGIMYQASRIPEDRLRPIFEESDWLWLQNKFDEARSREAMLKDTGYLPEDFPAQETARSEPPRNRGDQARPDRPAVKGTGGAGDTPSADENHSG